MQDRPQAPRWVWLVSGLLFLAVAVLLQRLAALTDGWFAGLGAFAFMGMTFDMLMIFLAAFLAATPFFYWVGCGPEVRRRLTRAFVIAYGLWTAFSFLLVANMLQFAPVVLGLAGFALAEAALGAVLIFLAVFLSARLFERVLHRRDEAAAIS